MRIVARRESGLHIRKRSGKAGEVWLLRQIAHRRARLREARAAIGLHGPGCDLEERRFAGPIASDQAHALALADRQLGAFKQRCAAEGEVNVLQSEERRRHEISIVILRWTPAAALQGPPRPRAVRRASRTFRVTASLLF